MKLARTGIAILMLATTLAAAHASNSTAFTASMLVTGKISVSPKGDVTSYKLDQPGKLPKAVLGMLDTSIPNWRFKPVMRHGVAVAAHADMSLRILATPEGNHRYRLSLSSSFFGNYNAPDTLREEHITPPRYPRVEEGGGVQGTVYLLLRINRDGRVDKAAAEQVNLRISDTSKEMQKWRHDLAKAAILAARQWTFKVPDTGPEAHQASWYASIPIEFGLGPDNYGSWYTYFPGPVRYIPWADKSQLANGPIDSQIPGTLYTGHPSLQRIPASGS